MPKVSIIVPVYNVEKYLKRCIQSILSQTFNDLELILINDGSSDKSGKICDKYSKKDNRIKVIHKENGGVSTARNLGLDNARGDYVMFVDSDDWLQKEAVKKLVDKIENCNADFCCGSFLNIGAINSTAHLITNFDKTNKTDAGAFYSFISEMFLGVCAKLFKRSIIKQNKIRFQKNITYLEDTIYLYRYLQNCDSVCSVSDIVYFYNVINFSSATKKYHPQINDWVKTSKIELEKIFTVKNDDINFYLDKQALLMMEFCFRHHVWSNDQNNRIQAIEFLKDAYYSFRSGCEKLKNNKQLQNDTDTERLLIDYNKFLEEEDYNGLYEYLCKLKPYTYNKKGVKHSVKRCVVLIKEILIFKLELFYI